MTKRTKFSVVVGALLALSVVVLALGLQRQGVSSRDEEIIEFIPERVIDNSDDFGESSNRVFGVNTNAN
jgi:hypothetical protein